MEQQALFDDLTNEIILKPLQNLCIHEIRQAFMRGKRIVFQAATGMGKTVVAAHIVKSALERGKTVAFIADRIVLCTQTSDVFRHYGIPHGVLQAQNERFDINQPVQICSIQTLKNRGCPKSDIIIIDEAHVLHQTHIKIIAENPDAYVLGLTATPYAKGMGKHFDFHIEPVPVKQLIANKYLVPFDVYGPSIADLSKLKVRAGEFTEESVGEVFDKADIIGDVVKTWQKLTPGKKTIVFGANIAHIKHLVKQFQEAGISADQVNAYDTDERDDAIQSFRRGDTTVLCSVEVLTKGFDAPEAEVCILAVATKSMIKWTQTTGRVLRTATGKERAVILDFGGNAERLGFPDDFEFLGLDDGKKKKKSEVKEKPEKKPKACPSCAFIKPVGVHVCPACGFAPEKIKNVDVTEGELKKLQRKAKKEYSIEEKQAWLAQLNQYAADHKMRRHWKGFYGAAIYAYADKFGTRPSGKIDWNARMPVSEEVKRFMIHRNIAYAKRQAKSVIPAVPENRPSAN